MQMMTGKSGGMMSLQETKDFGDAGCYSTITKSPGAAVGDAPPVNSTVCFLVNGGYLNLTVASPDKSKTTLDGVRSLLQKTAARRTKS
jgi:hypothetical protein